MFAVGAFKLDLGVTSSDAVGAFTLNLGATTYEIV